MGQDEGEHRDWYTGVCVSGCMLMVGLELIMVGRRIGQVAGVWQHLVVVESH